MEKGRLKNSWLNARINLLFFFITLILSFFSRKIFLEYLGTDFIGLTGTLGSILGYLNLAEFGITGCISYFLYKPLQIRDKDKIGEILSVLGYFYRKVGLFILLASIVVCLFFPWMFANSPISISLVYFTFFSFVGSSLIGYFINYRQIILSADQKNYVVSIYFQSAGFIKTLIQINLAYYYTNLYLWAIIEFVFSLIACVILNWKINKEYPWLQTNIKNGKILLKEYPDILIKTKQLFIHKIKDFVLTKSDELFIFSFVSLKMVAFYGNYTIIISKCTVLLASIFDSVGAGIGNLVAEGKKGHILNVFWELMAVRYFLSGFICFSLSLLTEPFISLLFGPQYLISHTILVLLMIYTYIATSRSVVDMYNNAYGLFSDTWSAWVELIINICITIIAGYKFGVAGILLGKILSTAFIVVLWKPYFLFSKGFKMSIKTYWEGTILYHLIFILSFGVGYTVYKALPWSPYFSFITWSIDAAIIVLTYIATSIILTYLFAKGGKACVERFKSHIPSLM